MKINIENKQKEFEINLQHVTQLIGTKIQDKEFIIRSIIKYFSKSKYAEYEEDMIDNIKINKEKKGREFFNIINIKDRESIILQLQEGKQTIFKQYFLKLLENINVDEEVNKIEREVKKIFERINIKMNEEINNFKLDYMVENIINMVSQSELVSVDDEEIYYIFTYKLLNVLIKMIYEIYKLSSTKTLVIIENIDHLITIKQYKDLIDNICSYDNENIYFFMTASINGFVYVKNEIFSGINVINEKIFNVNSYERMKEYFVNVYPCEYTIKDEDMNKYLEMILNEVGNKEKSYYNRAKILKSLINRALLVDDEKAEVMNNIEKSFIFDEKMI